MDKYIIAPPEGSTNNAVGANDRHWKKGYFDELPGYNEYLAESTGYGIVSGCTPSISGLTVTVAAGVVHLADGTRKEISATTITLDTADSTNPRIDLVYITSAGAVAKITGTAAASPSAPALPSGGISVAQVSVAANASTGTLTDVLSKNSLPFIVDNIAELRLSNFIPGRTVMTLGYHTANDGGSSFYRIRNNNSDSDNGGTCIILSNGYVAELIVDKGVVSPEQFGAYGDNVHDDINSIQAAIDSDYEVRFLQKTYKTSMPIQLDKKYRSKVGFDSSLATINYVGNDYAILIAAMRNSNLNIGNILAYNGGGIKLYTSAIDRGQCQYLKIFFESISANAETGNCIAGVITNASIDTDVVADKRWINEIRIGGGILLSGNNGVYLETNQYQGIDRWCFEGIGFEGPKNWAKFTGVSRITFPSFINCRMEESLVGDLIKSTVPVRGLLIINNSSRSTSYGYTPIDLPAGSDYNKIIDVNDMYESMGDKLIRVAKPLYLSGGMKLEAGDDLNNCVDIGSYFCSSNADATSILNTPSNAAFSMCVKYANNIGAQSTNYFIQSVETIYGRNFKRTISYVTATQQYNFGDWQEIKDGTNRSETLTNTFELSTKVYGSAQGKILSVTGHPTSTITNGTSALLGTISTDSLKPLVEISGNYVAESAGKIAFVQIATNGNVTILPRGFDITSTSNSIQLNIPYI